MFLQMGSAQRSIFIAIRALRRNKLQTILTMTGMTIGVATVLTMIALGSGAQRAIQDQVRAAGMNVVVVTSGNYKAQQQWTSDGEAEEPAAYHPQRQEAARLRIAAWDRREGARLLRIFAPEDNPNQLAAHAGENEAGLGGATTLTLGDAEEIKKVKGVQYVSAGMHENVHAAVGDAKWFTRLHGDDASLPGIKRAWVFPHGRFFNEREQRKGENVAVLGSIASEKLFGNKNPVGETITLGGQKAEVVGVAASSTWMVTAAAGDDQFDAIYIPITTAQRLLQRNNLSTITITTASTGDVTKVLRATTVLLRERHGITKTMPDDFIVSSQARKALGKGGMRTDIAKAVVGNVDGLEKVTLDQLGKTLDQASRTMSALLASIAAVSLIVGGIGIMNIMLLSVTERTREIGIRRAVGARSGDVMRQFLFESIGLSVAGGALGILIGVVAAHSISSFVQWSTSVSVASVLISFGISAAVGIFFGYYPAREASRVTPMTSLRYE
ncbi:ABC transporter permease [Granulicella sp. dw_53]|uniref:ABC transporter permease n=1 Tax=Granulicella sp. dw_53 TaxID=2719792 RepID=UPI001BD61806|nr:ABC transporter permease [Granulicella sp. dw_53]